MNLENTTVSWRAQLETLDYRTARLGCNLEIGADMPMMQGNIQEQGTCRNEMMVSRGKMLETLQQMGNIHRWRRS